MVGTTCAGQILTQICPEQFDVCNTRLPCEIHVHRTVTNGLNLNLCAQTSVFAGVHKKKKQMSFKKYKQEYIIYKIVARLMVIVVTSLEISASAYASHEASKITPTSHYPLKFNVNLIITSLLLTR